MAKTELELILVRLQERTHDLRTKIEDADGRMERDPSYDAYPNISAVAGGLNSMMATIEGTKKYEPMMPKWLRLQSIQDEVADLLDTIKCIQRSMLQDPSYKGDLDLIVRRLDELYGILLRIHVPR